MPITSGSSLETIRTATPCAGERRASARRSRAWRPRRCRGWARRAARRAGLVASQRASTTFCWLPPERNCDLLVHARAETASEESRPGTSRRAPPVRRGKTARTTPSALSRIDWLRASPVALRSSVISASPARMAARGERGRTARRRRSSSPRVNGSTPKTASSSSVRPEPCRPATPTISPARSVRSTPSTYPLPAPRELEPRLADLGALEPVGEERGDRAADHQPHELGVVELGGRAGGDLAAVLEHRDRVAEVEDLLEPVRDVEDRDAARGEPRDDRVEQLDLVVGERGGRLVHLR